MCDNCKLVCVVVLHVIRCGTRAKKELVFRYDSDTLVLHWWNTPPCPTTTSFQRIPLLSHSQRFGFKTQPCSFFQPKQTMTMSRKTPSETSERDERERERKKNKNKESPNSSRPRTDKRPVRLVDSVRSSAERYSEEVALEPLLAAGGVCAAADWPPPPRQLRAPTMANSGASHRHRWPRDSPGRDQTKKKGKRKRADP